MVLVVGACNTTPRVQPPPPGPAPLHHEVLSKWDIPKGGDGKGYRIWVEPRSKKEDIVALGEWYRRKHPGVKLNVEVFDSKPVLLRRIKSFDNPIKKLKKHWLLQATHTEIKWKPME
jgi:hypothetical protein